jgi:protoporphyrinogen oxidase
MAMKSSTQTHVIVFGAGPAGLAAAYALAREGMARVTVLERNAQVGGNAGSFELAGVHVDYGSHRLHPASDPRVLNDIHALLGPDLLVRPRHGRIRLRGRWIHFPLKPLDLGLRLPPAFALGVAADMGRKVLKRQAANGQAGSFASVLEAGLGRTICRDFYFPYARKLWGAEPEALSAIQAQRRVSAGSPLKLVRKVLNAVPGLRRPGAGVFYYPRRGFGQIVDAYAAAAAEAGADICLSAAVHSVTATDTGVIVEWTEGETTRTATADYAWSTIPVTALARALQPQPPADVLSATENIGYRAMILIYLVLAQDRFTEFDAHYFPEADIRISRLSETKNYAAATEPAGTTVLCAELPCAVGDPEWTMTDAELGQRVQEDLARAGLPVEAAVRQVVTRRLRQAYPIYVSGFEAHLYPLLDWLDRVPRLLTFGRQGLFAHDNTHHALYMGNAAAACLQSDGTFDDARWQAYRREFEKHVVED